MSRGLGPNMMIEAYSWLRPPDTFGPTIVKQAIKAEDVASSRVDLTTLIQPAANERPFEAVAVPPGTNNSHQNKTSGCPHPGSQCPTARRHGRTTRRPDTHHWGQMNKQLIATLQPDACGDFIGMHNYASQLQRHT